MKQLKNVVKDKKTDTSKEDNKSPLVSGDENSVFTSLANDETIADEIVSAPKSIKTEKEISFEEQKAELLKKRKMAEKVRKRVKNGRKVQSK